MSKFLDVARDHFSRGLAGGYAEDYKILFDVIHDLKGASFNAKLDLNNIETVLSILELGEQIGGIEGIDARTMKKARAAAIKVIGLTIDYSLKLNKDYNVFGPYKRFANIINRNPLHPETIPSIITFNYDCALDYTLKVKNIRYSYCLDKSDPEDNIALLKMHGSVNWQLKEGTVQTTVFPIEKIADGSAKVLCASKLLESEPSVESNGIFIIPPVINKLGQQKAISNVWRIASQKLQSAEEIYVIGYSLPETDTFFKYLFALGTHSRPSISRFWVFDPDPRVGDRFRDLVGVGLREPRFKFHEMEFNEAIDKIAKK